MALNFTKIIVIMSKNLWCVTVVNKNLIQFNWIFSTIFGFFLQFIKNFVQNSKMNRIKNKTEKQIGSNSKLTPKFFAEGFNVKPSMAITVAISQ